MQKHLQVFFTGQVQGVGFRFTAQRVARQFAVTGFVCNLQNGKVELVAEGERKVLEDFFKEVCEQMSPYIRDMEFYWTEFEDKFKQFSIKA